MRELKKNRLGEERRGVGYKLFSIFFFLSITLFFFSVFFPPQWRKEGRNLADSQRVIGARGLHWGSLEVLT